MNIDWVHLIAWCISVAFGCFAGWLVAEHITIPIVRRLRFRWLYHKWKVTEMKRWKEEEK